MADLKMKNGFMFLNSLCFKFLKWFKISRWMGGPLWHCDSLAKPYAYLLKLILLRSRDYPKFL